LYTGLSYGYYYSIRDSCAFYGRRTIIANNNNNNKVLKKKYEKEQEKERKTCKWGNSFRAT